MGFCSREKTLVGSLFSTRFVGMTLIVVSESKRWIVSLVSLVSLSVSRWPYRSR